MERNIKMKRRENRGIEKVKRGVDEGVRERKSQRGRI